MVAAGVSVWGALVSVNQYELARDLAEEQRFVSVGFEVSGDCKARLNSLPDQAHLQELHLIYGEYEHPTDPASTMDYAISADGTDLIDLGPIAMLVFADQEYGVSRPILTREQVREGMQANCSRSAAHPYCDYFPSYETRFPILAHYTVELRGTLQEYWAVYGLRVANQRMSEQAGSEVITCNGLPNQGWFGSETEAREALRSTWAELWRRRALITAASERP